MYRLLLPCLVLGLSLTSACAPALSDDFAQDLSELSGCGDVVFYAVDEGNQIMLTAEINHPNVVQVRPLSRCAPHTYNASLALA